jgi:hypothetical protein
MDLDDDPPRFALPGLQKRPRSPDDFGEHIHGFEPGSTASEFRTTAKQKHAMRFKKRRLSSSNLDSRTISSSHASVSAALPAAILQHIFTFTDPVTLGRLLRVNRLFRSLLDPDQPLPQTNGSTQTGRLAVRKQNSVWAISRRLNLPGFPKPMDSMTEIEAWRLLRGSLCQYCGKKSMHPTPFSQTDPFNCGPGLDNVRSIWPFRVRSCGSCLRSRLIEVSILTISIRPTPAESVLGCGIGIFS